MCLKTACLLLTYFAISASSYSVSSHRSKAALNTALKSTTQHFYGYGDPDHVKSTLQNITEEREASTPPASSHPDPVLLEKLSDIRSRLGPPLNLYDQIMSQSPAMALAAEFKRASPSKGQIALSEISCGAQASSYFTAGASIISVLTEPNHFKGSLSDMLSARSETQSLASKLNLPRPCILRKDFITSRHMILEAASHGADTVLLIVAVTPSDVLKELIEYSRELGMEPLVEIHADEELDVALKGGAKVIGVNNRNLHTFKMDMTTTTKFAERVGEDICLCSLSGMSSADDVERYRGDGVRMVLIGESLMRSRSPELAIKSLGLDPRVEREEEGRGGAYNGGLKVVKVCGVCEEEDAVNACREGANMIGVIFAESKRKCSRENAKKVVQSVRKFGERSDREDLRNGITRGIKRPLVVGVFQNEKVSVINEIVQDVGIDVVQLHGDEGEGCIPEISVPCIRVVSVPESDERSVEERGGEILEKVTERPLAYLLDTKVGGREGGTGVTFDHDIVQVVQSGGVPVIVAGGLSEGNVREVARAGCFGVDVSSGVEKEVGKKDDAKIKKFVDEAWRGGEEGMQGI
ncbi:hypothetical protein TrVE_jg2319 [Triparma verrucosa]|uniref:Indole-3-glycerol phosphate synthase n=1 Tax=Triparma verrucosa TaxID=1606542 RepID=A0A9W7KW20_9STRA|nr:hypothetical protein TrVE_jg2319 [Triparma verrucosa]